MSALAGIHFWQLFYQGTAGIQDIEWVGWWIKAKVQFVARVLMKTIRFKTILALSDMSHDHVVLLRMSLQVVLLTPRSSASI